MKIGDRVKVIKTSHSQLFELTRPVNIGVEGEIIAVKLQTKDATFYTVKIIDSKTKQPCEIWFVETDLITVS